MYDPELEFAPDIDLLADLNQPQREAVCHAGSPVIVVAGAGSGKTRVLTRRIAYLVKHRGVHPANILAITFTNKAASEMRERVVDLVGARARKMWVSTFHAACVRILRAEIGRFGISRSFSIYDATDSKRLIAAVMKDQSLDPKRFHTNAAMNWISTCKNELVDYESAERTAARGEETVYAEVYRQYQQRLAQANALDFDDLIMMTVQLLQRFPQLREAYRRRFRQVLVDEYQDTNHAQYMLIRELCAAQYSIPEPATENMSASFVRGVEPPQVPASDELDFRISPGELLVVGDSDQSIYAFRGATIRNIIDFEQDFPGARTIVLEQNYRSTQNILSAANQVITCNPSRLEKKLWTDSGTGELIVGYVADTEHDEAHFVAEEVNRLTAEKLSKPGETAVFYRTNAQSRVFEEVFIRTGVPYQVIGGVKFYERKEVRDAVAYLRVIANPADDVSVRRILNVPRRGIGERAETLIAGYARSAGISFFEALQRCEQIPELASRSVNQVAAFVKVLAAEQQKMSEGVPADQILASILHTSGYADALSHSKDPQDSSRLENLVELVSVAAEFVAAAHVVDLDETDADTEISDSLPAFLERIALVSDSDDLPTRDDGMVTLMTLHTAKGLEFETVFLTGLEEGIFPHALAMQDLTELHEERRLVYVGITRARSRLYFSRATTRMTWGAPNYNPPSRFISEVPDELISWRNLGLIDAWKQQAQLRTVASGQQIRRLPAPKIIGPRISTAEVGEKLMHSSFGIGTVVAVDLQQNTIDIRFESGVKRLALAHAPLQKL